MKKDLNVQKAIRQSLSERQDSMIPFGVFSGHRQHQDARKLLSPILVRVLFLAIGCCLLSINGHTAEVGEAGANLPGRATGCAIPGIHILGLDGSFLQAKMPGYEWRGITSGQGMDCTKSSGAGGAVSCGYDSGSKAAAIAVPCSLGAQADAFTLRSPQADGALFIEQITGFTRLAGRGGELEDITPLNTIFTSTPEAAPVRGYRNFPLIPFSFCRGYNHAASSPYSVWPIAAVSGDEPGQAHSTLQKA